MPGKLNAPAELDLYAVLGVEPTADRQAIQRQYKQQAKLFHPDVNPRPDAVQRMQALNDAYRVLSDPERREAYDSLIGLALWAEDGETDARGGARDLKSYSPELDDELPIREVLARRQAAKALVVRKTDYRQYEVASLDQTAWYKVSADRGCACPDANGVAGPFGCKHWYAMEAFRNNGDRPVDTRHSVWAVTL
ncbi:MAG: J domain-containing protein [Chloroflexota bacterium]|nr:J domain-containing protein [Chloroflexota bacterium]